MKEHPEDWPEDELPEEQAASSPTAPKTDMWEAIIPMVVLHLNFEDEDIRFEDKPQDGMQPVDVIIHIQLWSSSSNRKRIFLTPNNIFMEDVR